MLAEFFYSYLFVVHFTTRPDLLEPPESQEENEASGGQEQQMMEKNALYKTLYFFRKYVILNQI